MKKLNAEGLLCPMPVIRLQNEIKKMMSNEEIEIICTDPGTKHDIPTWCRLHKNTVLSITESMGKIIFLVRKD